MSTEVHFFGKTDQGVRRTNNEDRVYWKSIGGQASAVPASFESPAGTYAISDRYHTACDAKLLLIVIDGMGGQAAGETAAEIAEEALKTHIKRTPEDIETAIRRAIIQANNGIFAEAENHPDWRGMACVLTVAVVENNTITMGHVGDARLYKFRPHAAPEKLSRDQSPVGEREDAGELTEDEAMRNPRRNEVYNDVGSQPREDINEEGYILFKRFAFAPNEALLLCSDGLTDLVTIGEIRHVVEAHAENPCAVVEYLIHAANQAGGKDNISVIFAAGEKYAKAFKRDPAAMVEPVASNATYQPDAPTRQLEQPISQTAPPYFDSPTYPQHAQQAPPSYQQRPMTQPEPPRHSMPAVKPATSRPISPMPLPPGRNSGPLSMMADEVHQRHKQQAQAVAEQPYQETTQNLAQAPYTSNGSGNYSSVSKNFNLRNLVGVLLLALVALGLISYVARQSPTELPNRLGQPSPTQAESNKLLVGKKGKYLTIGEALEQAKEGDTIEIEPGTYPESLVLSKDVTLQSSSSAQDVVIESPGEMSEGVGITISNSSTKATLIGIRVQGTSAASLAVGIQIINAKAVLKRVSVTGTQTAALEVRGEAEVKISDSKLKDNFGTLLSTEGHAQVTMNDVLFGERKSIQCLLPAQVTLDGKPIKCVK